MSSSRWDAVLFDLDGTLADTVGLILACYRHTMRAHLGAERPDAEWLAYLGTPLRDQLRGFARDEAEAAAMLETYLGYQRVVHDGMAAAFPGVLAALESLRAAGARAGIVTSKTREMGERTLDVCGLRDRFDALVFADDVARGKPHPEPVLLALARLGEPDPGRVLFVGDSPHDIEAGRRAGVRTGAVLWGPFTRAMLESAEPDYWVESVEALRELLTGR